jgi:hypothetical protein
MEEFLDFVFVHSKDALKVKTFLGTVPRNIECINYMDIYNKLTKNDYFQSEPSDAVVSSYLMKQLQTLLGKDTTSTIYYVLEELNEDVILGIKEYVLTLSEKDVNYHLIVSEDLIDSVNGAAKLVESVNEFDV